MERHPETGEYLLYHRQWARNFTPARRVIAATTSRDLVNWSVPEIVIQPDEIDENGPITYPDVAGDDQPIWVQHLGDDAERGWYAFLAVVDGDCIVEWQAGIEEFVDCDTVATGCLTAP